MAKRAIKDVKSIQKFNICFFIFKASSYKNVHICSPENCIYHKNRSDCTIFILLCDKVYNENSPCFIHIKDPLDTFNISAIKGHFTIKRK